MNSGKILIRTLLIWAGAVLATLSAFRLGALFFYGGRPLWTHEDLVSALIMGFRFDLSAVCYFLTPALLVFSGLWISGLWTDLLLRAKILQVIKWYLSILFFAVLFLSVLDIGYYSYFQDHLNIMVFGFFEDDTWALVTTFWKNYPILWLFLFYGLGTWACFLFLSRAFQNLTSEPSKKEHPPRASARVFISLISVLALGIGARGGFGLFPLGVADASLSKEAFVNYLAFSGFHSLHRAIRLKLREDSAWNVNALNYGYTSAREAAADFLGRPDLPESEDPLTWFNRKLPASELIERTKPHVVVLVMESFGGAWLKYQSPEFNLLGELESHFKQDFVFMNFTPSMTATIGSLSSLMINTSHRPEGAFLTESRSLQVPFRTAAARIYHQAGYRTRFVYGGAIGWRDIDKFARTQGFESIEGDFEIEKSLNKKLERHDWGFFDEDVWTYLEKTLNEAKTPELVVVMTTTNHPPYQLPATYKALPLKIPGVLQPELNVTTDTALDRFRAFQYSNQKLGEFLTRLKKSDLGKKTVLAATGDHGFLIRNFSDEELLQKWQVPFYLYIPPELKPTHTVDRETFGSHVDIFATLMPLSLSNVEVPLMGQNLLDPAAPHEAFHFSRLAFSKEGAVLALKERQSHFMNWAPGVEKKLIPTDHPSAELTALSKKYKALMSYLDFYYEYEHKHAGKHK